mmetsp:Transcript_59608/g.128047  ORF Transcript_59608/g.128047 Transcript_59608/m.128047 type:complete len:213 (-) Transcript_59608:108-746(-)
MAFSEVRTEGRIAAAKKSVYWIVPSPSGSSASSTASSSSSGKPTLRPARACRKPCRESTPALASSSDTKAALRSSTSRLFASCATSVSTAFSKREKCAKERMRPMVLRKDGVVTLGVLFAKAVSALPAEDTCGKLPPPAMGLKHSCSSAALALARLLGSFTKRRLNKSRTTGVTPLSSRGSVRIGACKMLSKTSCLSAVGDATKGCCSVSTM